MVLISSYSGKKFNDSPKTLYDAMKENGLLNIYKVIWAFDNPKDFECEDLHTVKIDSMTYFLTAFKAKYWITNVNIERGLKFKKRKQIYLNTWHGTGPKTAGNGATGRKDYNFKRVDILCADGEYVKDIFVRDFNANPSNIVLCGRPREDKLYHPTKELEEHMRSKYNIKQDDFVILYAPTWREPKKGSKISSFDIVLDIDKILNAFPNSKVLFRAHSITSEILKAEGYNDRFFSATDEPDIGNLFLITNVLITDYSSSALDITILNKPFICFAPDYDDYIKERSLYFDVKKEYPFGIQQNTDEVIEVLHEIMNGNTKSSEFRALKQKYTPYGGNATKICLEKLFDIKQ